MSQTSWIFTLTVLFIGWGVLWGQEVDNRTLFTVEGTPVTVDEFTYIYSKTNGEEATFSEESLQEYLDLYVKFKLKVQRAKEMRLDTIVALQEELAGYRRQLADSYLIDRAIGDQLIREAYEHTTQEVDFSHILFGVGIKADPKDTLAVYKQAVAAMRRLQQGEDFEAMARLMSMDKYSRPKGGRVGFVTAMLPAGFHKLENAIYETPIGQLAGPVRTNAGYHLLKVHARRPARGEVEAAHIVIRKKEDNPGAAKAGIDSIYQRLQNGEPFEALARLRSEDGNTNRQNGYLGFFGINRYEKAFEDAAFGLTDR
jgi:peptidyl-prolyl cis-trans isomerase SurA